jgi:hypothetical protein
MNHAYPVDAPMRAFPFWRYYGGKFRAAPRYPKPIHGTIIEPFAGAAGYALRYPDLEVILVERDAVLAEMWRFLLGTTPAEVRRIPAVEHVDELPAWVPEGARHLVGFAMNNATVSPCKQLSAGRKKLTLLGRRYEGWNDAQRERVALQVPIVKHWRIIEGDYTAAPTVRATWFVDPPYSNKAGSYYVHSDVDYSALAAWCQERVGQVIVCENEGATWLPFRPFATFKAGVNGSGSKEVIWTGGLGA